MADPYAATRTLIDERPERAAALESILAVDDAGPWTFEDVEVDSGTFGELVSRGIVERDGDTYRVADREAVEAALTGEAYTDAETASTPTIGETLRAQIAARSMHRDGVGGLLGALVLLVVFRTLTIRSVFHGDRVVLPGNDPYHYLYWVEQLARAEPQPGLFAWEAIAGVLGGRAGGDPLAYTVGWWATELTGAGVDGAAGVVAWLPVLAAVAIGVIVWAIALLVTNDERIAVAAVVVFALLPGHALYSGIGFFDHSYLDYLWLALSILAVTWLAWDHEQRGAGERRDHLRSPVTWLVVALLGVVVAAMALTWDGSPVLLVGLAVYATIRASSDIRAGWNPLVPAVPVIGALGLGFWLAYRLHAGAGWGDRLVVVAPLLVAIGVGLVASVAWVIEQLDGPPAAHLALSGLSVVPIWVGLKRVAPDVAGRLQSRAEQALFGRVGSGISETRGLFDADYGVFFGPVDHFGWFLFVALPVLAWVIARCVRAHEPRWLVVTGYATALIGFALIQIRFAAEATVVVAILAGVGVVYLLSVIDVARRPEPFGERENRVQLTLWPAGLSRQEVGYAVLSVGLVASLSVFMVPAVMDNVAASDDETAAIEWMDAHAATHDGPDYVLTEWGRSRMFNYGVNGESDGYGYARSNYEPFVSTRDPDSVADRFQGRVGYVAIKSLETEIPPQSGYAQLFEANGSATDVAAGSGRFQLAYVSPDATVKVFRPVTGARLVGTAPAGEAVTVETQTPVAGENSPIAYERRTTADENGTYTVVVAHPGSYVVRGVNGSAGTGETSGSGTNGSGGGELTVTVPPEAVQNGTQVAIRS